MNQKNFQLKDGKVQPFRVEKPIKKLQNFNYSLVAKWWSHFSPENQCSHMSSHQSTGHLLEGDISKHKEE